MHLFNTFMGLGALIVAGLIGATITFLLMSLGLPNKYERQYYELRRAMQDREWVNKQTKKGVIK